MTINQRSNADAAYLAGRVPFEDGLYVVGPYASRVSFASQQRRALSLICSIEDDLRRSGINTGLENKDVAVIGAGLAGLTCAVALAAFRSNVWVFEKQEQLMKLMKHADHRDIHPTVNFWPQEQLEFTTLLPFFNWYSDSCDAVLRRIENEWNDLRNNNAVVSAMLRRIGSGHELISFERDQSNEKWRIKIEIKSTADAVIEQREFDILVFAVGFGLELPPVGMLDVPSYWNEPGDRIRVIQKHKESPCDYYIVSGTGDGGVIEVLRLLFTDFRAGSIDPNIRSIFTDTNLAFRIQSIESAAQKMMLDRALHNGFPMLEDDKDVVSAYLWNEFLALLVDNRLGQAAEEALKGLRSNVSKVYLLGERISPLELSASPFHKLLIACAVRMGCLEYFQLAKDEDSKKNKLKVEETARNIPKAKDLDIRPKKITFEYRRRIACVADGTIENVDEFAGLKLDGCLYVGRHGYTSPISNISPLMASVEKIKRLQRLYADQDWITSEQAESFAKKLELPLHKETLDWAKHHAALINDFLENKKYFPDEKFLSKLAASVIPPTMVLDESGNPIKIRSEATYRLSYKSGDPGTAQAANTILARVPERFVGIKVDRKIYEPLSQPSRSGH